MEREQAAELIGKRAVKEAVILVRVILGALGTRLGTLLLCGPLCLSNKWPFVFNFSSLSLEKREKILQWWFRHRFLTPIRAAVLYIKALSLYNFFTRVMPHTLFAFSYIIFSTLILFYLFILENYNLVPS